MDNVATVSDLSGNGTSSINVDANGGTIILRGNGTTNTTANLTLANGLTLTGADQLLMGGGGGAGSSSNGANGISASAGGSVALLSTCQGKLPWQANGLNGGNQKMSICATFSPA